MQKKKKNCCYLLSEKILTQYQLSEIAAYFTRLTLLSLDCEQGFHLPTVRKMLI